MQVYRTTNFRHIFLITKIEPHLSFRHLIRMADMEAEVLPFILPLSASAFTFLHSTPSRF